MVGLGAGASLAGLVSAVPQLVWLSEHKALVFGIAGALLVIDAAAVVRGRRLPCPADFDLARACLRLRRWSAIIYSIALAAFAIGCVFEFVLPLLS